jgi:hypothetical protein
MAVTHISSNQAAALQRRPAAIAPIPRSIQDQQARAQITGSKSHPPTNETADEHTQLYYKKRKQFRQNESTHRRPSPIQCAPIPWRIRTRAGR